jgi:SAM-dependent methyltransferase
VNPQGLERSELEERIAQYRWYHRIPVADGLYTPDAWHGSQLAFWKFLGDYQATFDLAGKDVLDVGCRDGLFSLQAERQGARRVVGIDNDLSRGATEFLLPFLGSAVEMHELNLYDLRPENFGTFDVVLCYGVLYHLRYPMLGLRRLMGVLSEGGVLLLESAMLVDRLLQDHELVYCPVERSPYEPTSCTFFNVLGLEVTMRSLGMAFVQYGVAAAGRSGRRHELGRRVRRALGRPVVPDLARLVMVFEKRPELAVLREYWEGVHRIHTSAAFAPTPAGSE